MGLAWLPTTFAGDGRGLGDVMLRFAIILAVGAAFLAVIAPGLLLTFTAVNAPRPASAHPLAVRSDASLVAPSPVGGAQVEIVADPGGQYAADVQINGQNVKMLVDTGATMVVISYETASRLGFAPLASDYTQRVRTANGTASVAPVTLREVTIGPVYVGQVNALVAERTAGEIDLLGMSFLKRLASVEQREGKLVLRQ